MSGDHRFRVGLLALLPLAATGASAQAIGGLDVTAARVEFAAGEAASVLSLAPSLRWDGRTAGVVAYGTWSRFAEGLWSAQGAIAGSAHLKPVAGVTPEVGGALAGTLQQGGEGTGRGLGALRLHLAGRRAGVWAGGALGRASDGEEARTTVAGEAGAWLRMGEVTLASTAVPNWIGDGIRYTELLGVVRVERGRLDLSGFGGWRTWSRPDATPGSGWAGVNLAVWLTRHLALIAGAASYPTDWGQGLPSGRFAMLSARLATRRPGERRAVGYQALPPLARPVVAGFELAEAGDGRRVFRVRAPGASRVELMGDFTAWEPVALARGADGRWSVTLPLPEGLYRMNIRVDGGEWGVPPRVLVLDDEFGGVVGILEIEQ